ncbi:hypothetical protein KC325_g33 [Hortaea werneckii]|nr:hypothetical protein KC325_g33 [Hortaea werneckii]
MLIAPCDHDARLELFPLALQIVAPRDQHGGETAVVALALVVRGCKAARFRLEFEVLALEGDFAAGFLAPVQHVELHLATCGKDLADGGLGLADVVVAVPVFVVHVQGEHLLGVVVLFFVAVCHARNFLVADLASSANPEAFSTVIRATPSGWIQGEHAVNGVDHDSADRIVDHVHVQKVGCSCEIKAERRRVDECGLCGPNLKGLCQLKAGNPHFLEKLTSSGIMSPSKFMSQLPSQSTLKSSLMPSFSVLVCIEERGPGRVCLNIGSAVFLIMSLACYVTPPTWIMFVSGGCSSMPNECILRGRDTGQNIHMYSPTDSPPPSFANLSAKYDILNWSYRFPDDGVSDEWDVKLDTKLGKHAPPHHHFDDRASWLILAAAYNTYTQCLRQNRQNISDGRVRRARNTCLPLEHEVRTVNDCNTIWIQKMTLFNKVRCRTHFIRCIATKGI